MISEYECELVATEKILAKYGSVAGIDRDLVNKIFNGNASEAETNHYITNASKIVEKFKADMRQTAPANYSDADVEIIVAISAGNHAKFQARNEPFSKVMPQEWVAKSLQGQPTMAGFAASHRYSEHLSPAQTISQFGLDYQQETLNKTTQTKTIETPYMLDVDGKKVPQPLLYYMKTPMNESIRESARIPFDPRVLERVQQMAKDPARAGQDIQKMAEMVSRPEVCTVIAQNTGTDQKAKLEQYAKEGYSVKTWAYDAPYTGNTMPQYGSRLEGRSAYSDIVQETALTTTAAGSKGTAIYIKVPRRDDAGRDIPDQSEELKVAEWDGKKWAMTATREEIDGVHAKALASAPAAAREQLQKRFVTHDQLAESFAIGAKKSSATENVIDASEFKRGVKKKMSKVAAKVQRKMLAKKTGSTEVAVSVVKYTKQEVAENKNRDETKKEKDKAKEKKNDATSAWARRKQYDAEMREKNKQKKEQKEQKEKEQKEQDAEAESTEAQRNA